MPANYGKSNATVKIDANNAAISACTGKRGYIISEYRKNTTNPIVKSPTILPSVSNQNSWQSPYSPSFFLDLLPDYMESVYPVQPVITEDELRAYIQAMESDQEIRSFIYAFGGCTLNLTRYGERRTDDVLQTISTLVNHSIESRTPPLPTLRGSVMRAMQSMFLHNCLMSMQASEAAFFYMRDSISTIQLLRVDTQDAITTLPPPERARRQRLYWQAFIHERFVAVLDYRQAILPPLESLPDDDSTIPISVQEGFNQIIRLFSLLDTDFLRNWLGSQTSTGVTITWIEQKSRELDGQDESSAKDHDILTTMQRADLAITREWLRTLVWRLAMSRTLLSSRSSKECLSLLFPVRLSQQLRRQVSNMSREDIGVHGSTIVQKLFEITDTIADVLILVPAATLEETALRIEDFLFILDFVLLFPALDQTRRSILIEKLERLQAMFPEICSTSNSPNVPNIFDAQSPLNDPWYHVTQSKILPEMNLETEYGAALADANAASIPDANTLQGFGQSISKGNQKATWNEISRRLSMANMVHG
ncbi:hypothetical protein K469DRAFT_739063 [Zopfia rhizophila CBS 207.26]|uniref:Transcription factor domain-containing protein n=1 Tax=Zopfia rhizophila CBS 207.26 TaxID=1314779 RepID=A0A6A6E3B4_9PEZI|nr:hypothetical protein K469DRAFT_739063 [Zopfia rhizophila CBS 207.26]